MGVQVRWVSKSILKSVWKSSTSRNKWAANERERWRRTNGRHYIACSGKPHFQHSQQVPLSMPPCLEGLWLLLRASKIASVKAACHAFLAVNCLEHHGKWITPTHLTLGLWKGVIWRDESSPVRFAGSQEVLLALSGHGCSSTQVKPALIQASITKILLFFGAR